MNPRELLLHSNVEPGDGVLIHVDASSAGWEFIGLTVHRLEFGAPLTIESDGDEYAIVLAEWRLHHFALRPARGIGTARQCLRRSPMGILCSGRNDLFRRRKFDDRDRHLSLQSLGNQQMPNSFGPTMLQSRSVAPATRAAKFVMSSSPGSRQTNS